MPKGELSLKRSDKKTVCFALYEKVDKWTCEPLYKILKHRENFNVMVLDGFSYDSYIKNHIIGEKTFRRDLAEHKISFGQSHNRHDQIFLSLIKEKFNSLETRVLLEQLGIERQRMLGLILRKKVGLFIMPEDTDAIRGRLAATIAKAHGIKSAVILPLYYEWITAYPLFGERIAGLYIVTGSNYKARLLKCGVARKYIHKKILNMKLAEARGATAMIVKKGQKFYLAILQDNDEQEVFIDMVLEAFKYIPNVAIVFKFHPTTAGVTKKMLKRRYKSKNASFSDSAHLDTLIKNCEGLLTISSTCAIEAMRLKKPVIIIDVSPFPFELPNFNFKTAATPEQLLDAIKGLNNASEKQKYIMHQNAMAKKYLAKPGLTDKGLADIIEKYAE